MLSSTYILFRTDVVLLILFIYTRIFFYKFSDTTHNQSALTGCITGICCMSWICLKAQADIALKILTFQYKPLSTEGCTYDFNLNLTYTNMNETLFSNPPDFM